MKTEVRGQRSEVSEQGSGFRVQGSTESIANCKLQIANCKLRTEANSGQCAVDGGQCIHPSSFILHPSSPFTLQPTAYSLQPPRRGISLLEVLVAIFVLSIGLLGVAALIPLGQISLWETAKADRSGACGRAAMRDIQVRRMLDFRYWYWLPTSTNLVNYWGLYYPPYNPSNPIPDNYSHVAAGFNDPAGNHPNLDSIPFVIDPLGRARGMPEKFGEFNNTLTTTIFLPRRTLRSTPLLPDPPLPAPPLTPPPAMANALAEQLFFWNDDLPFDAPKNSSARPTMVTSGGVAVASEGSYSWFFTVVPAGTEMALPVAQRRLFNVSVAVCYKRNFEAVGPEGEHTTTINPNTILPNGFPGQGIGGGTVLLNSSVNVKQNQWVLLYHVDVTPQLNRCCWYRVVGVGTNMLSLDGPDWDPTLQATLVVVPGVIGVYSTTMELDWDPLWTK